MNIQPEWKSVIKSLMNYTLKFSYVLLTFKKNEILFKAKLTTFSLHWRVSLVPTNMGEKVSRNLHANHSHYIFHYLCVRSFYLHFFPKRSLVICVFHFIWFLRRKLLFFNVMFKNSIVCKFHFCSSLFTFFLT